MQYFGGKQRIAKKLLEIINSYSDNYDKYYEPFVGGGSVLEGAKYKYRFASDANKYLIAMYKAIQKGWQPPTNLTEEEYDHINNHRNENPALTAFVGIGCSYSGKWFGGYSKNKTGRNYCLNAYNSIMKQKQKIMSVDFSDGEYDKLVPFPYDSVVYCDPPYAGTTGYSAVGKFDTTAFWNTMRKWSKDNNIVLVSEYSAPDDFECVLAVNTKLDIRNKNNEKEDRVEKLFKFKGY